MAKEYLQAGNNEEAIRLFEEAIIRAPSYGIQTRPTLKEYLALSYLRLGEQQNCVENHNSQSCLFPINLCFVIFKLEFFSPIVIEFNFLFFDIFFSNLDSKILLS